MVAEAMMTLAEINTMEVAAFVAAFGDVAEHSPWMAEKVAALRPFATREALVDGFGRAMLSADTNAQLALLRAHPDLAGKAKLTPDSQHEQAGAGLDRLTPVEFAHFT
jgi:2-oxo-4-hydroxy-4-carboxy-5-ureidoimidazoline decarboxylase